jgi:hypothetical protein
MKQTRCLLKGLRVERGPSGPLANGCRDDPDAAYPDPAIRASRSATRDSAFQG